MLTVVKNMRKRKAVLIVDNGPDSLMAIEILRQYRIEFVEYDIRKFLDSCCGDLPTTEAPAVIAPEGVFKGISGIKEYATLTKTDKTNSESAYW